MHADRLQRMADLLRRDAANPNGVKFDLSTWASPVPENELRGPSPNDHWSIPEGVKMVKRNYTDLAPLEVPVSCGTFACAFGLAAISGEFKAEGLSYTAITGCNYSNPDVVGEGATGLLVPAIYDHSGTMQTGFEAAEVLFDISAADAKYFFDPDSYDGTPREAEGEIEVADRIEAFIRGEINDFHEDYRSSADED